MATFWRGSTRTISLPRVTHTARGPARTAKTGPGTTPLASPTSTCRIPLWRGSIRASVPSLPPATHSEPKPNATSLTCEPRPPIGSTSFVFGSIRVIVLWSASATQTEPAPTAIAAGLPPIGTSATTLPVFASSAATEFASTTMAAEPPVASTMPAASEPARRSAPPTTASSRALRRAPPRAEAGGRAVGTTGAARDSSCARIAFCSRFSWSPAPARARRRAAAARGGTPRAPRPVSPSDTGRA
jgi:hypothetical protein